MTIVNQHGLVQHGQLAPLLHTWWYCDSLPLPAWVVCVSLAAPRWPNNPFVPCSVSLATAQEMLSNLPLTSWSDCSRACICILIYKCKPTWIVSFDVGVSCFGRQFCIFSQIQRNRSIWGSQWAIWTWFKLFNLIWPDSTLPNLMITQIVLKKNTWLYTMQRVL